MKKVVVAEASPTIKSVADSLLRQNGYDVVCTSDGLQAWEIITSEKPDLVLVGQGLSGITGLDLCRQIALDRVTGGIPVVLMIGAKDAVSEEQIIASGARGKLRKPFSPKDLLDVADRLAGQAIPKAPVQTNDVTHQKTKFTTQVSSTQHLRENKEPYNLEWLDLSETDTAQIMPKVASFDVSSEDQGLVIDEDQYGLSNPQVVPEPEILAPSKPKKDEDYEWFLGEIKKEMEGKAKLDLRNELEIEASAAPTTLTAKPSPDPIKFDDIVSAGEPRLSVPAAKPPDNAALRPSPVSSPTAFPTGFRTETEIKPVSKAFSDEEISLLADRIAGKLAAQIAAKIDKSQIIEAVKAILNQ